MAAHGDGYKVVLETVTQRGAPSALHSNESGLPQTTLTAAPEARAVYAIGDVHGMAALLDRLLDRIAADAQAAGMPATLVFLGDVVNRGPDTKRVLDRLCAGPDRDGDRWIVLRGNHEQAMLDALQSDDPQMFARWLRMGGMATLKSYGGSRKHARRSRALALIDPDHLAFLATLPFMHVSGAHLFVHAGVEPGLPLAQQCPNRLTTIRGRFLRRHHGLPFTVVHGHTPSDGAPTFGPGRICIDTGAYHTGVLTALAIDPRARRRAATEIHPNGAPDLHPTDGEGRGSAPVPSAARFGVPLFGTQTFGAQTFGAQPFGGPNVSAPSPNAPSPNAPSPNAQSISAETISAETITTRIFGDGQSNPVPRFLQARASDKRKRRSLVDP